MSVESPALESQHTTRYRQVAHALGWFSIALGAAEVIMPRQLAKLIGAPHGGLARSVIRAFGVREVIAGVGLLSSGGSPAPWLWARAAGDALDLTALGVALGDRRGRGGRLVGAIAAVAGVTGMDIATAWKLGGFPAAFTGKQSVRSACTINRPLHDVYTFWRNIENLPQFMAHVEAVKELPGGRSQWRVRGPGGVTVAWEAELTHDDADHSICWRSLPGADIDNAGEVRFVPAPGLQGTEVHVQLSYSAPAGAAGAAFARLWGQAPDQQVRGDLRRFKEIMEAGEVLRSDASVHRGLHAAQPPAGGALAEVLQ